MDLRPEAAEAIGTFGLVFAGAGAIMSDALGGGIGHVGVSLVFGFIVLAMVYALGHISGAHINPAVTVAFAAAGHFPWRRVPFYVAAQVLGAVTAAFALRGLLGTAGDVGATQLAVGRLEGAILEALATGLLAFVVLAVATDERAARGAAGLAIGLTVAWASLVIGPLTGASLNPARSIGPALASGALADLWLYVAAPVLGAVAGMGAYQLVRPAHKETHAPLGALGPVGLEEP